MPSSQYFPPQILWCGPIKILKGLIFMHIDTHTDPEDIDRDKVVPGISSAWEEILSVCLRAWGQEPGREGEVRLFSHPTSLG